MNILSNLLMMNPSGEEGGGYTQLIFIVLLFAVFYFFMIRPQMKKQKELRQYREKLAKGDKIITNGGIYGKIVEVKETSLIVEIAKDVHIKIDKSAVVADPGDIAQQK